MRVPIHYDVPRPYEVIKKVPYTVKVPVDKPYPVPVPKPYTVVHEKPYPVYVEKKVGKKYNKRQLIRFDDVSLNLIVTKLFRFQIPVEVPVEVPKPFPVRGMMQLRSNNLRISSYFHNDFFFYS